MIIPSTEAAALLLLVLSMFCWASWANFFKLSGSWRFEFFYFDFSVGLLLAAVIAAFTLGSLGANLSFQDNLLVAGKTEMAEAAIAGVIFNLGNLLLVASLSLTGMAVSFPIAMGAAVIVGAAWSIVHSQLSAPAAAAGMALTLAAAVLVSFAWALYWSRKHPKPALAAVAASGQRGSSGRRQVKKRTAAGRNLGPVWKGIILAAVGGLLLGSYRPLADTAGIGDIGLGPYSLTVFFGIAVFLSTFVFNLYFMNLPVAGQALGLFEYFQGSLRHHLLGLTAGVVWCAGLLASLTATAVPKSDQPPAALVQFLGLASVPLAALWGVLVWREFAAARPRVRVLVTAMFAVLIAGIALISVAVE